MPKTNKIRNIVIFRTDRIGEVLLSTVAIDMIKAQYPMAKVSFVTSSYSKPLLEDRDDIENVLIADTFQKGGEIYKALALSGKLRKHGFDTAIILNPHKVLHLACFFAGIPLRAGYDRKWGFLLSRKIQDRRDEGSKHEIQYTHDLLKLLEIDQPVRGPHLPVNKKADESMMNKMAEKGIFSDIKLIIVHPGSSNPSKIWPRDNYVKLIRKIKKELSANVIIVGSVKEKGLSERIISEAGAAITDLTGELSLKELAALLKKCDIFIGNDTGPMHMAAALGVPVIAVFGRNIPGTGPVRWRPWGDKHNVFHHETGCAPCRDAACEYDHKCLDSITVSDIFNAAEDVLRR